MRPEDPRLLAADENMLATWRAVLAAAPAPEVVEDDTVVCMSSGLPVPLFNPAFVRRAPEDGTALIERVTKHYAAIDAPYVVYFRDAVAPGLADVCAAAGMIEHFRPPLMVLDALAGRSAPPLPAGLEIEPLTAARVSAYSSVIASAFQMPPDIATSLFGETLARIEGFSGWLGLVDGEPVATSGLFMTGTTAGVYNIATLTGHRGRGIGEALTWAAVHRGEASGALTAILQASSAGVPVYERMGFVTADRYRQFQQA